MCIYIIIVFIILRLLLLLVVCSRLHNILIASDHSYTAQRASCNENENIPILNTILNHQTKLQAVYLNEDIIFSEVIPFIQHIFTNILIVCICTVPNTTTKITYYKKIYKQL